MNTSNYGPQLEAAQVLDAEKYRGDGESFYEKCCRLAGKYADYEEHREKLQDIFLNQRFLAGGRIQAPNGSSHNCFVSQTIEDSMDSIMDGAAKAAQTMRMGGGIGYDFSKIRPSGDRIVSIDSSASGPLSFMDIYDAVCNTIVSAGHRRGAQMGVLRVDHPDIHKFLRAKQNNGKLTNFNISVGITDKFMQAVEDCDYFDLVFDGRVYETVDAGDLWDEIMRSTWDWAEPGVLFLDRINEMNNLHYCEDIQATNPCLHPDSIVETVHGRVKIKDIKEPTQVYTMDTDGSLGISEATASWISKKGVETINVNTRNGKTVRVTKDHLIHTDNGWKQAGQLRVGERVTQLCRARRGVAYSGVKLTTEDNRAYRMEHRMVANAVYGVGEGDDVHHIDGDTYNNSIDNLEVMPHSLHSYLTATQDNPQTHQRHTKLGDFKATGVTPKTVMPMPEDLRSNMKNHFGNCVSSITEGEVTDVYDLTVSGTHNFIADFTVVHNCAEQPLPPNGACLLGSFNLTKYVQTADHLEISGDHEVWSKLHIFNWDQFKHDIPHVVRMMDNVIDLAQYPLPEQENEAKGKRRMGLGITGLANAGEAVAGQYGSDAFIRFTEDVMSALRDNTYRASVALAIEKGSFDLFDRDQYLESTFIKCLPMDIYDDINKHGIRNSHLLSIAPTGTISFTADNVSSGIEPVYSIVTDRVVQRPDGPIVVRLEDYGKRVFGVDGIVADALLVDEHLHVLLAVQKYVDSSVSKTVNVGGHVTFNEFKDIYMKAYHGGAKGCTTFRASGKRFGQVLTAVDTEEEELAEGTACFIDPTTGNKECS